MRTLLFALLIMALSCKTTAPAIKSTPEAGKNILIELLNATPAMQAFIENKDSLHIQVIYTQIDRNRKNDPHFTDHTFNLDPGKYFYPASTVKMPIAFLALEKLAQLKDKGIDRNTVMITDSSFSGEQVTYTQPLSQDSRASIAHYIKQVFLVSDNDASNRLYEFLGQEYIYDQLRKKGFEHSVIRHRLAVFLSQEQNKHTNPVSFHDPSGAVIYDQSAVYSKAVFPESDVKLGRGYYSGNTLVNAPFDFSLKNNVALADLHGILRSVIFPGAVKKESQFNMSADDRDFLLRWMSSYPKESRYPYYDTVEYANDYSKFIGRGILSNPNIRIFSKAGWAYGFLTDVAYVIDLENNIEFMLSATILSNSDGVFNDDTYDFEKTGFPFMKLLGQIVYQHELKNNKKHKPDLSSFRFNYSAE